MNNTQNQLNSIYEIIGVNLEAAQFKPNKSKTIYLRKGIFFTDSITFHISRAGTNSFQLHITLDIFHNQLEQLYKHIIQKVYHDQNISLNTKIKFPICNITDWKDLCSENNIYTDLWFTAFSDILNIKDIHTEFNKIVDLSNNWFQQHKSSENILKHCFNKNYTVSFEYYLLIIGLLKPETLLDQFNYLLSSKNNLMGWDKSEVNSFFKYLNENKLQDKFVL